MTDFPNRTWQSDLHAGHVRDALDRAAAGENFMVSVVTTMSARVYVALSGSTRANLLDKLEQELSFAQSLQDEFALSKARAKTLDREKRAGDPEARVALLRNKAVRELAKGPLKGFGIYVVVKDTSTLNRSMMDSDGNSVRDRIETYREMVAEEKRTGVPGKPGMGMSLAPQSNPLTYPNSRDCAEPKVIQAAASKGERVLGMTTIWYGRGENEFPDRAATPELNLAVPCSFCKLNEQRIMIHVAR